MRELKFRFGLILALALLPLLIFSVGQSYTDYAEDKRIRRALLDDAAVGSVSEVIEVIDSVKSVLKYFGDSVTDESCDVDVRRLIDNFPKIYNVVVADTSANSICAAIPIRSKIPLQKALDGFGPRKPFTIDLAAFKPGSQGPQTILIVSYGVRVDGEINRAILAGFDIGVLRLLKGRELLPRDVLVTLFSENGSVVIGENEENIVTQKAWIDKARLTGRYEGFYTNEKGKKREITVLPTEEEELFVAISAPISTVIGSVLNEDKLHPLFTAFIPFFAWLLGCVAIWLTTDKLILEHIHKIRLALNKFGRGDNNARVILGDRAPTSISDLGRSLNGLMARVGRRETELRTSLSEKETLLREIHHRVKNNLQIIISLLNMQERKLKDPSALAALEETKTRVNAIALVHQALYEREDITIIEMGQFLDKLLVQLGRVLLVDKHGIVINSEFDKSALDSDRATPVALFIVEAVTNSVKHGVSSGGQIYVSMLQTDTEFAVSVEDTGEGVSDGLAGGMGSRLMRGFARQLSGVYEKHITETGYRVSLSFSKDVMKDPASHIR